MNNNNNNPVVIASGVHGNVPFVRMQIAQDAKPVTVHPDKAEVLVNDLLDAITKARRAMATRFPGLTACRDCDITITEPAASVQSGRCYECHATARTAAYVETSTPGALPVMPESFVDSPAMKEYMALTGHPDTCAYWDAEATREEELETACDCGLIAHLDAAQSHLDAALPVTPVAPESYTTTDPITGSIETARQRRKRENREAWANREK